MGPLILPGLGVLDVALAVGFKDGACPRWLWLARWRRATRLRLGARES